MDFNCFTVRDYADSDNDPMYPRADEFSRSVALEESDGDQVMRAVGTGLELVHQGENKRHRQIGLEQIKVEIVVTDSRIGFAVPKYDKGGGWLGGAGAIALNAASKVRAAVRSRGKCLVGHVKYPWLTVIGHGAYFSLMGNRKHDQLRIGYSFRSGSAQVDVWLEIDLASDVNGHALATEILNRAVDHRLDHHPSLTDEQRGKLEALRETGLTEEVTKDRWTQVLLPATKLAMASTATFSPPAESREPEAVGDEADSEVSDEAEQVLAVYTEPEPGPPTGSAVNVAADWYVDPGDDAELRYWDGSAWTEHIANPVADAAAAVETDNPRGLGEPDPASDPGVAPVQSPDRVEEVAPVMNDQTLAAAAEEVGRAGGAAPPSTDPTGQPIEGEGHDDLAEATAPAAGPKPAPTRGHVKESAGSPADWYPDPAGQSRLRYWDGSAWTEHVAD